MRRITLLCAVTFIVLGSAIAQEKRTSSMLSDWIHVHLKLVRTSSGVPHVGYSRHFANTSIAFYEALVPGEKDYKSLAGQLNELEALPTFTSKVPFNPFASGNAAYAAMLRFLYSKNSNAAIIDSMESAINTSLEKKANVSKDVIRESAAFGKSIASAISTWCEKDGYNNADPNYKSPVGDAMWQPTPPSFGAPAVPHWMKNRTLVKGSTLNVIDAVPPAYSTDPNSDYYKMAKEVFDVSQKLTPEQKDIAWFWDDSPGKYLTVSGHWSSILSQVIGKVYLMKAAEAYAKMHIALHDATIAAWYGKYTHNVIRPVTYIRKYIKSDWEPVIETPPHPEFPAAHATLSSAAATGLTSVLGNKVSFRDDSYRYLKMKARSFASFEDAAKEAGFSRLYGGIHYSFSIREGLKIGKKVAENALGKLKFK